MFERAYCCYRGIFVLINKLAVVGKVSKVKATLVFTLDKLENHNNLNMRTQFSDLNSGAWLH